MKVQILTVVCDWHEPFVSRSSFIFYLPLRLTIDPARTSSKRSSWHPLPQLVPMSHFGAFLCTVLVRIFDSIYLLPPSSQLFQYYPVLATSHVSLFGCGSSLLETVSCLANRCQRLLTRTFFFGFWQALAHQTLSFHPLSDALGLQNQKQTGPCRTLVAIWSNLGNSRLPPQKRPQRWRVEEHQQQQGI